MKLLGLRCPLPGGWLSKLIGTEMSDQDYAQLCEFRKQGKTQHVRELFSETADDNSPEAEINAIYLENRSEFE